MDATDWAIIEELQADGRLSINALARRLPLSAPAVAERVRRLEAGGVITGYHAAIDPRALGLNIHALIRMGCDNRISCVRRELDPTDFPEVTDLHRVTGDDCSVLVAHSRDMGHLEALLDRLSRWSRPSTSLILSSPIQHAPLRQAVITAAAQGDERA